MIQQFAIKVTETVTSNETGNSHISERYFQKVYGANKVATTHQPTEFYSSRKEAWEIISDLPHHCNRDEFTTQYTYSIEAFSYGYANMHGWSDVEPFEIVRVISDKTIVIKKMIAETDENWKPEIIPGGFAGHCVNQNEQKWSYKSAPDAIEIKARLGKKGWKSAYGKHVLSTEPRKFYDYNF